MARIVRKNIGKKPRSETFVALLRGINVGGHNKVPMADLRTLCSEIGWENVGSYIQSGNLVFSAAAAAIELERQLEESIQRRFGLQIAVIVRHAKDWFRFIKSNPFPEASKLEPNLVMLALSKRKPEPGAVEQLRERANNGEKLDQTGDVLWIHFRGTSAGSKLSPAVLDRFVGSPVTLRNWRTVLKIEELAKDIK